MLFKLLPQTRDVLLLTEIENETGKTSFTATSECCWHCQAASALISWVGPGMIPVFPLRTHKPNQDAQTDQDAQTHQDVQTHQNAPKRHTPPYVIPATRSTSGFAHCRLPKCSQTRIFRWKEYRQKYRQIPGRLVPNANIPEFGLSACFLPCFIARLISLHQSQYLSPPSPSPLSLTSPFPHFYVTLTAFRLILHSCTHFQQFFPILSSTLPSPNTI